jgi:hypothetical protein
MPTYQVETDEGVYELELEGELPEGPAGERLLQRLLRDQFRQQSRPPESTLTPQQAQRWQVLGEKSEALKAELGQGITAAGRAATQVAGGVRDAAQGWLELPASIFNVIGEFISPDAPGGPRRRLVPEVSSPQLPDVSPPQSGLEKALRVGGQLAGDTAGALLLPPVRHGVATLGRKLRPGAKVGNELMFEPGSVAREIAERQMRKGARLDYEPGSPTARGARDTHHPSVQRRAERTLAEPTELLRTPPSEGVQNLARLFGFEAEEIPQMSQAAALVHRKRLLTAVPDYATQQEAGPVRDLLERLEEHLLRFR